MIDVSDVSKTGGDGKGWTTPTGKRGRGGRPPVSRAGEVGTRILEAATRLFLRHGFEGTSCDQVALDARAGKASIYARYANKEALFAAVIQHHLARGLVEVKAVPAHQPLAERLRALGLSLLEESLKPGAVALLRVLLAEAPRLPGLDLGADRIGWQGGVPRVAEAIAARDRAGAKGIERATPVAVKFIELVVVPCQMRALLGEEPGAWRATAPRQIEDAIAMLTTTGWLDGWA